MKLAATFLLVLLVPSAFSAPNPFHLPSLFGGGGNQAYSGPGYSPFQLHPRPQIPNDILRGKPRPSSESSPDDSTPKPSPPPAPIPGLNNAVNEWFTMPFRPNVAPALYVPTLFAPVTTPSVAPPSVTKTAVITTTIYATTAPPSIPHPSSAAVLEVGQPAETPLPTVYVQNR